MDKIIIVAAAAVVAGVIGYFLSWRAAQRMNREKLAAATVEAERVVEEAKKEAEIRRKEARLEAREEFLKLKGDFEREVAARRQELDAADKRLSELDTNLGRKTEHLDAKEKDLVNREKATQAREKGIALREEELDQIIARQNERLQKIAQMTPEEAKKQLMDNMINAARMEAAQYIKEIREKAEADAEKEAREIILSSIYRCAADHTVETTVSVVNLPNDEMKGRIIGREGRNIRSFETATGID
ncbi:MAG TPA: Rnase Y domain-containing protein, partial [candidate division Zixibacteria bacterium]|nr:Rnase Y domain-containing protein [candidate division Zixibacteria bacterium]